MNINLLELWSEMGLPVRTVVIVLTLQAIASLAVAVDRLLLLFRSRAVSSTFAARAAKSLDEGAFAEVRELASKTQGSHLALVLFTGLDVFLKRTEAGDSTERAAELARRAIERKGETLSTSLNKGMGVLASTGSTAPFVGLLGTVLGIINAFQMIAASGSGGIGTIGAAIGEALIVTGYGLCVAIPTVLGFNYLSGKIAQYEQGLTNAGSELTDRLETSGDVRRRASTTESSGEVSLDDEQPALAVS
ncbi:MAG: MotA/TolQ/ExbB proton channel family protein [Sandaracinaceae bacterium]|nr:MotA/TolQ/ExbB proton channel family protein [Sandaracinaceae bacterium]